jgi:hypothetical protein
MAVSRGSPLGIIASDFSSFWFSNSRWKAVLQKRCATSGGGYTLRSRDLEMILAWHNDGVSDGRHSADVMKKEREGFC